MKKSDLTKPVAIFDAGIGSYAIVDLLHKQKPQCDILYFADRANFPYGNKSHDELAFIMRQTFKRLLAYDPAAIIIASNAPSIMVFDQVLNDCPVPLYGVFPPLKQAEDNSKTGHIAILGVASMVESEMGKAFVKKHSISPENVALINASSMVELVESGIFLFDPEKTQKAVQDFMDYIFKKYPKIDTFTLSSTHLPWLQSYFEKTAPHCRFLDPAQTVIDNLTSIKIGNGNILGLVSENAQYKLVDFQKMLQKLDIDIPLKAID